MLCQNCQLKPAVFHYTRVINGVKQETHLCAACFEEMKGEQETVQPDVINGNWIENMLFGLPVRTRAVKRCSACGWSAGDIQKTGKLGCPDCYTVFSAELSSSLKRLSAGESHRGRRPLCENKACEEAQKTEEISLDELKKQLQAAVEREEYEKAAALRDRIRGREGK